MCVCVLNWVSGVSFREADGDIMRAGTGQMRHTVTTSMELCKDRQIQKKPSQSCLYGS